MREEAAPPVRGAGWYPNQTATFADTLALIRQLPGPVTIKRVSAAEADFVLISRTPLHRLTETLAFAA